MNRILIVIILQFLGNNTIFSQIVLNRDTSLEVKENGISFKFPFAGGINSGQFSEIDLNLDGILDLIVFDKSGDKITPFIKQNNEYKYAPEYQSNFPDTLHDWVLIYDYNCDGKNDLYTYSTGGMAIYKNTSTTTLSFDLETPLVMSNYGNTPLSIFISPVDIPAISDIDNDGDLDILTFSVLGGFLEYHKNMSIELGNCDTIVFEFSESCWGLFYEGLNDYILDCNNCQCPNVNITGNTKEKHAGSTILAIDIDNDNDKDLILGDVSFENLNLLINGGDNQNSVISHVDSIFPQNHNNTIGANIHLYPAAYYIDVTNDNVKDLIVTTNSENNSENFESCWLYENMSQNNTPDFQFIKTNLLQDEMIDVGNSSFPVFYDYNNDGLLDIVVGNYGYHNANNNPTSSLAIFENTGSLQKPEYTILDRDWLNISNINLNTSLVMPSLNISPTFGDINGDGQKDLIVGDADGKIHLFTNTGNGNFQITNANYNNIDVGYFAHPQIVDVNRDGLNDIIIGEQDGTINYLPNSGSISVAIFDTLIKNFGNIDVDESFITTGFSTPKLIDINGSYHLFIGSYTGKIYHFTNIDGNLNGVFTEVNSSISNIREGGKTCFTIADITNDNQLDMMIGNLSGGLSYFSSDSSLINPIEENELTNNLSIFPNPSTNEINIKSTNMGVVNINDIVGKRILTTIKEEIKIRIDISFLPKGIYIIELNNISNKLIVE